MQAFSKTSAVAAGGTNPDPADASMAQNAIIYRTTDGVNWAPVAAPETSELHGLAGFADATYVADWSGRIWRWNGELAPVPPTRTPTATPTITETPTETPTPTATATVSSSGQIEVVAFHDLNLNGQPDSSDAPLPNVGFQVRLNTTPVATGATGANGRKVFGDMGAGEYTVAITTPAVGYTAYYSQVVVGLAAGSSVTLPFPHLMASVTPSPRGLWLPVMLR